MNAPSVQPSENLTAEMAIQRARQDITHDGCALHYLKSQTGVSIFVNGEPLAQDHFTLKQIEVGKPRKVIEACHWDEPHNKCILSTVYNACGTCLQLGTRLPDDDINARLIENQKFSAVVIGNESAFE